MDVGTILSAGWSGLVSSLPSGLDLTGLAREHGAFVRQRQVSDGASLLRLALLYGPGRLSLRDVSALASGAQVADLSSVALYNRLCRADTWLEAIVSAMLAAGKPDPVETGARELLLIDGTAIGRMGETGAHWLLHSRYKPGIGFTGFELTDHHGGETLRRHPIERGAIVIADRFYGRGADIAHVTGNGADFIIRCGWRSLAWRDEHGNVLEILPLLSHLTPGQTCDLVVNIEVNKTLRPVRLVVEAKPDEAIEVTKRKVKQKARQNARLGDPRSIEAARYMIVATSLEENQYPARRIIELYRVRWQIELSFKRLKSLIHLRTIPAKGEKLARTWLYAHLIFALMIDRMTQQVLDSPP